MLIFDNFLFASFIPQILMFLGVISCFTAPYLSSGKASEVESDSKSIAITTNKNTSASEKVCHFTEYHKQTDAQIDDKSSLNFLSTFHLKIELPHTVFSYFHISYSSLFNRPPPFSSLA